MTIYRFEITDTFNGEANYSWVRHYQAAAKSLHGALCKVSRKTGFNFNFDGYRYNAGTACVCMFDVSGDENTGRFFESI